MNKRRKCKQNNKGMTLVEVLVAITVLLVISGAFLKSFALAAKINKHAKFESDALVLAEGMMESFKAYDMEEIQKQFSNSTSNADFKFYKIDSPLTTKMVNTDFSSYSMRDVQATGGPYSIDIEFNPVFETTDVVTKKQMDTVDSMNPSQDAIFEQSLTEQSIVLDKALDLLRSIPGADITDPSFPQDTSALDMSKITILNHIITVNIYADYVDVVSSYDFTINGYQYRKSTGGTGHYTDGPFTVTANNTGDPSGPYASYKVGSAGYEDIYIYYYPSYYNTGGSLLPCPYGQDKVVIKNNLETNKDVYVVKQKSGYYSSVGLVTAESYYKGVVVNQNKYVRVFHNLSDDLSSDDGSSTGTYEITGTAVKDMEHLWELTENPQILVYNIEIKVTDSLGESYTLKGSMNAK